MVFFMDVFLQEFLETRLRGGVGEGIILFQMLYLHRVDITVVFVVICYIQNGNGFHWVVGITSLECLLSDTV